MKIEKTVEILKNNALFQGLSESEIKKFVLNLKLKSKIFQNGDFILNAGDIPYEFGIVLSGKISAVLHTVDGNDSIYATMEKGDHFADILSASSKKESPVSVIVAENNTEILFVPFDKVISYGKKEIVENLFFVISKKYWNLVKKIDYLSIFSLKKRICKFLIDESEKAGSLEFTIPFDRDGMASYLASDRSAVSRILSDLKKEGIIDFKKNKFQIKNEKKMRAIF